MSRYFEFKDEKSNKFWSVSSSDKKMSIHYGKIGTAGQKLDKEFESAEEAVKDAEKAISKKLKEGYIEGNLTSLISPQLVTHLPDMAKSPKNPKLTIAFSTDTQQMSNEELFAEVLAKHKGNKDIKQEIKWCKNDESNAKHLAELLIDNGDLELARKSYNVAIDDFSDDIDVLIEIAYSISCQSELNGKEWARLLFENILKKTLTPQKLVEIAECVTKELDDKEWGRQLYEEAFKKADNYRDFKTIAVSVFQKLGDEQFARQAYQKAVDNAEDVFDISIVAEQIASIYDFTEDRKWARQILTDAIQKCNNCSDFQELAVSVYAVLGEEKLARELFQKAVDTVEDVFDLVYVANKIADADKFTGDKKWAKQVLTDAQNKFTDTDGLIYLKSSLEELEDDENDISKQCSQKAIYIKTEPGGRICFGRLSEDDEKILLQAVAR